MPASLSIPTPASAPSLAPLQGLVQSDMEKVNALIFSLVENHVALIPELSRHIISSGGKRLRPMLTLATSQLCGYQGDVHITLATSVEFMHTATLLHDDVVDGSDLRRGLSTANHVWGNKASILVGDYLLGKAFHLMVKPKSIDALDVLSHAAMVISEGEVLQLSCEGSVPEESVYFDIINAKTAELFAAACEISAIISSRPENERKALRAYGMHLGRAFQITDDALDYSAKQEALGKTIGDDFREGKATLPVILAYQHSNADEKLFWQNAMAGTNDAEHFSRAMDIITKYNIVHGSMNIAKKESALACKALSAFPDSSVRQALEEVAQFAADRAY